MGGITIGRVRSQHRHDGQRPPQWASWHDGASMSWRGFTYGLVTGLVLAIVPLLTSAKITAGGLMGLWMLSIVVDRVTARSR